MKKFLFVLALTSFGWTLASDEAIRSDVQGREPDWSAEEIAVVRADDLNAAAIGLFSHDRGTTLEKVYLDGKLLEPERGAEAVLKNWSELGPTEQEAAALKMAQKLLWVFFQPKNPHVYRVDSNVYAQAEVGFSGMRGWVGWKDTWTIDAKGQVKHTREE